MSSPRESDRESGVGVGGLAGGTRCANALALGDGTVGHEELGGDIDKPPLRARFRGGDTDEGTEGFFSGCWRLV